MKWSDLIKVSVLLSLSGSLFAKNIPDYKDRNKPVEVRVHDLLRRMTLEEKIAELNLVPYYASSDSAVRAQIRQGKIGALLKANGAALPSLWPNHVAGTRSWSAGVLRRLHAKQRLPASS